MAKNSLLNKIFGAKKPERRASKNTETQQILAKMADDINITKLNVIKLVEIQKETPATKAEDFFERQKEKENAYESGFRKGSGVAGSTSPTKVGSTKTSSNEGPFDFLKSIFNTLIKGGLLVGLGAGLLEVLKSPENRKSISDFLRDFFVGFLGLIKTGSETLAQVFSGDEDGKIKQGIVDAFVAIKNLLVVSIGQISELLSDPKIWEGLYEIIKAVFKAIVKVLQTEVSIEGVKLSLGSALVGLIGAMAILKGAALIAAGALTGIGRGGLFGGRRGGRRGGGGRLLKGLGIAGVGLAAYDLLTDDGEDASEDATGATETKAGLSTADKVKMGGEAALLGSSAYYFGKSGAELLKKTATTTATAVLDARTQSVGQLAKSTPKTVWGKFLAFVARKSPQLWGKVALKLAQAGTLATIPILGWVGAAIQLGFAFWTAWELYELWKEFSNAEDDTTPSKAITKEDVDKQQQMMQNAATIYGTLYAKKDTVNPAELEKARLNFENEQMKYAGMKSQLTSQTPASTVPSKPTPTSGTSTTPTVAENIVPAASGSLTFNQLTKEQQDVFLRKQAEREGFFRKGTLPHDLNNPGAIVFSKRAEQFGAVPNYKRGTLKAKDGSLIPFAQYPTPEAGFAAQRDLWSRKYGNVPLDTALRQWVAPRNSKEEVEFANYKGGVYAAIGKTVPSVTGEQFAKEQTATSTPPLVAGAPAMPNRTDAIAGLTQSVTDMKDLQIVAALMGLSESLEKPNITNNVVGGGTQGQDSNIKSASAFDDDLLKILVNQIS